ncbi:acyltransferase family protein [uncultured Friedmanniella sp.]|uniref:acyltransferase family protein n=1 Tax=uncultured Friedmanniella sp. TaxID=335381 RepID=UPI0035CAB2B0
MTAPPVPLLSGRLPALDGLRGLAALVVVVFHAMLVLPSIANVVSGESRVGGWLATVTYTPLRLVWSGEEAVLVFFVLSGVVLTLPFRTRPFSAVTYYPRRLVRIYLPVWTSVALALLWSSLVPRVAVPGSSWWVNGHDFRLTPQGLGGDLTLLLGTTWLNSVLWSLRWEMWFSLLLPLYLLLLVRFRRWPLLKLVLLLGATEAGALLHLDPLRYLPVFGVGVLLATELDRLGALLDRVGRLSGSVLLVLAVLVLTESRWLTGQTVSPVTVLAAAALVVLFARWAPAVRLGAWRPVHWLGTVSFSLYLVHEPIVTSVALLLHTHNPAIVLLMALPASLLVAAGFYQVAERPSHHLSRWAGALAARVVPLGRVEPTDQSRVLTRRAGTPT